ncbi:hypothetical protein ACA910_007906 [Epithemia clementina (nom. ined.)]
MDLAWYINGQGRWKLRHILPTTEYKSTNNPTETNSSDAPQSADPLSWSLEIPKCHPTLLRSHYQCVQSLMDKLEADLSLITMSIQYRDSLARKIFNYEWSFVIGQTTNALGAKNFEMQHNFKPCRGVCTVSVAQRRGLQKWKKSLWSLAHRLLKFIDPNFAKNEHFVVSFSCIKHKSQYVRLHRDTQDISFQYALGLGDYKGVVLRAYTSNNTFGGTGASEGNVDDLNPCVPCYVDLDYKRTICKMDGRLPHELIIDQEKFSGTRYSIFWFKLYDPLKDCCDPIFNQPQYV